VIGRDERELIQRWYDGEALGAEALLAERLVVEEPDAMAWLESLERLAGGLRRDLEEAVSQEDFSGYWDAIAERLPAGPLTMEPSDGVLRHAPAAIERRRRPLAWLLRPLAAAAGLALLVVASIALVPEPAPPSYVVEILELDSDGAVVVLEATADTPMLVSFEEG